MKIIQAIIQENRDKVIDVVIELVEKDIISNKIRFDEL